MDFITDFIWQSFINFLIELSSFFLSMLEPSVGNSVLITWLVQRGIINCREAVIGRVYLRLYCRSDSCERTSGRKCARLQCSSNKVLTRPMESPWAKVTCWWSPLSYKNGSVIAFLLWSVIVLEQPEWSMALLWAWWWSRGMATWTVNPPWSLQYIWVAHFHNPHIPCAAYIHLPMQIWGAVCPCMVPMILSSWGET